MSADPALPPARIVDSGRRVPIPTSEIERLIEASTIPALPERTR